MAVLLGVLATISGIVLAVAGIAKLGNLRTFGHQITAYHIVPAPIADWLGFILPPAEIGIGISTILSPRYAVGSAALYLGFAIAVGVNLMRGKRELRCGCFGTRGAHRISYMHVTANILLACASLAAFHYQPHISFSSFQAGSSAVALLGLLSAWRAMKNTEAWSKEEGSV